MGKTKYPHKIIDGKEVKQCNKCLKNVEINKFYVLKIAYDGRTKTCKDCLNLKNKELYKNNAEYREKHKESANKWKEKNLEKYKLYKIRSRERNKKRYLEYQRKYAKNNKEKKKWLSIKNNYGLTKDEWLNILESQDMKCAICRKEEKNIYSYHTDHDHKTGKVRGLLCIRCNLILSSWTEAMLQRCIEYINK